MENETKTEQEIPNTGRWVIAFTTDNIHMEGHTAPGFKEATKFANMLWRAGYTVHAIFDEKAYKVVDWEEFEKNQLCALTKSE